MSSLVNRMLYPKKAKAMVQPSHNREYNPPVPSKITVAKQQAEAAKMETLVEFENGMGKTPHFQLIHLEIS